MRPLGGSSPRVRGTPPRRRFTGAHHRFIPACAGNASRPRWRSWTAAVHPRVCGERGLSPGSGWPVTGSSPRVRGTPPTPRAGDAIAPVHPRVCGERRYCSPACAEAAGSSPRVRGTHHGAADERHRDRFIPACAGNAASKCSTPTASTVHPRVCGERATPSPRTTRTRGSSPRVRGTRGGRRLRLGWRRFIPACAGNARRRTEARRGAPVHPRVCGERVVVAGSTPTNAGSSPRVRGTLCGPRRAAPYCRFIPACAGNAAPGGRPGAGRAVHPRVCGERVRLGLAVAHFGGSSPRVRGTPVTRQRELHRLRFIPACAGNAPRARRRAWPPPVHPRVCGERYGWPRVGSVPDGSSPRVRGTRQARVVASHPNRFIPACAGNARRNPCAKAIWSVHPRVCGERRTVLQVALAVAGSSPRVRGTPARGQSDHLERRFIPACAGNADANR